MATALTGALASTAAAAEPPTTPAEVRVVAPLVVPDSDSEQPKPRSDDGPRGEQPKPMPKPEPKPVTTVVHVPSCVHGTVVVKVKSHHGKTVLLAKPTDDSCDEGHGKATLLRKNRHGAWVVVATSCSDKGHYRFVVPKWGHYRIDIGQHTGHTHVG